MHRFSELVYRCTYFSLSTINEAYDKTVIELSETGATTPVKNLQSLNLQRMIHAVGMFSIFEAHLQLALNCKNGFKETELILEEANNLTLKEDFHNCYLAINALKHGDGASYAKLLEKISTIDFVVETPETPATEEGDVSGVMGLVRVDDNFIKHCLEIIEKVSECISTQRPGVFI
ncbi:hypothetical protein C3408_11980 [Candidatus Pantoea alvi]|uniref:hypothetical protein n=1 Tax=Enterobacter agglomerans TaxID=549 RepID=UPI000CDE533A|nr:hypothetical protein [Pantoea agglomerans]POW57021.1 hypothetical protein C3408_11980 [Pantoea alvi]UBN52742.1 hypothetical protein LB453_12655 [Pantoea agglomerans]